MSNTVINVLFLCAHNSARSIIAEALLNHMAPCRFRAYSAGSSPRADGLPDPLAMYALETAGIPTAGLHSKSWDEFAGQYAPHMGLIISLCDDIADEVFPKWPGHPAMAHWGYFDPADAEGSSDERLAAYVQTMHAIRRRLELLVNLPEDKLAHVVLADSVRELASNDAEWIDL